MVNTKTLVKDLSESAELMEAVTELTTGEGTEQRSGEEPGVRVPASAKDHQPE